MIAISSLIGSINSKTSISDQWTPNEQTNKINSISQCCHNNNHKIVRFLIQRTVKITPMPDIRLLLLLWFGLARCLRYVVAVVWKFSADVFVIVGCVYFSLRSAIYFEHIKLTVRTIKPSQKLNGYASQLVRFGRKTKNIFYQAKNLNFAFYKRWMFILYLYIPILL